ncbi:MAG TPA: hypothetical protein PKA05_07965 [Roseiflexaceae bacterium]|nr:hypothetical protein [Roseiflexaceae bacterium]HMP40299.1 hypothetical protein [Roseiflexaceae bacterium]
MDELRTLFSVRLARGALLRADGSAFALVGGGAPAWELLAPAERARIGADYHRMLLALETPLDIYSIDEPLDPSRELQLLLTRQNAALDTGHLLHAAVLGDIAAYLADLAGEAAARTRQVIWVFGSGRDHTGTSHMLNIDLWLSSIRRERHSASSESQRMLQHAAEQARRFADALAVLGGTPPPQPLEPEAIAWLLYRLADPIRARRFGLNGRLLERIRRLVAEPASAKEPTYDAT